MKILLTGGAGFIGSNTAAELLSAHGVAVYGESQVGELLGGKT